MESEPRRHDDHPADAETSRKRLQLIYENYSADPRYWKMWRPDTPAARLMSQRKWTLIRQVLQQERLDGAPMRIVDLGVGSGTDAAHFSDLKHGHTSFVGLDLREAYIRAARTRYPWMNTLLGDAGTLPFRDGGVDLVYQSTMLSSVQDDRDRARIFHEIDRVLAKGGVFLSYDTRYPNPLNPHTRPLALRDVVHAFPGWRIKAWSLTAIPQLQRTLASHFPWACRMLEAIPVLHCHLLILAQKREPG